MNKKPNILLILTDQQSAEMMSCAGNPYLNTPAMDSLASSGVRFEKTYCTNPVCVPSRFSLMTGRMPSEIALRSNEDSHIQCIPEDIKEKGLGYLARKAGYDPAYGGKVHLPKMSAEDIGFNNITDDERKELAQVCADFIKEKREKPFFLVASFINPHDICYMAIRDENPNAEFFKYVVKELEALDEALKLPENMSEEEFFNKYCPPLPDNFEPQEDEPEAVDYLLNQRTFKKKAREEYSEKRWRLHRWAYCRLTEMVDTQIGQVLDAVKASGKDEETVIIFTSDHGDMDSAHRL